jgi:hypothetical protein
MSGGLNGTWKALVWEVILTPLVWNSEKLSSMLPYHETLFLDARDTVTLFQSKKCVPHNNPML